MKQLLTLGIIGKSLKENEKRVAIHPEHIEQIPKMLLKQITFEEGYDSTFGIDDSTIANLTSGEVATREEILNNFDCIVMPKPLAIDLVEVREGAIIWGWSHCVQQEEITQIAIDRKLTLIAWEEMFTYTSNAKRKAHIFSKNNEIAGYAGVLHALGLVGISGSYGKLRKAAVLGYGSVAKGAVYALQGQGFKDITIYTDFLPPLEKDHPSDLKFKQIKNDGTGKMIIPGKNSNIIQLSEALKDVDIIVNGVLQDPLNPVMFVSEKDANKLKKGTLIVDISCDEGMGFWCSKPTTFKNPIFEVGGKFYYAVDHTPSFHWNSATWEISEALLSYLPVVMGGENEWKKNETIAKAIDIREGVIQNSQIISFQKREIEYPHKFR